MKGRLKNYVICHFIISKNPHQGLINNGKHQPKASQGGRLTENKTYK